MIISASRRTDIPAFYSEWFIKRLREQYLLVQNPYNAHKFSRIDLDPKEIDAIVFWTKNPKPLLQHLSEIDAMGYKYYFQFTLTGYPKSIEPGLPDFNELISTFIKLSEKIGEKSVIWRYDPIVISTMTDRQFIVTNFERIAKLLHRHTKRVVISFADFYKKVAVNIQQIEKENNIKFFDINFDESQIYSISEELSAIARKHDLDILSCSEKIELANVGIRHGKCIDDDLLKELFGASLNLSKDKYQREECGCVESKDIGQYNSCLHHCAYCYANFNKQLARKNRSSHDSNSPCLYGNVTEDQITVKLEKQMKLL
jgi:hypothetical protein